MNKPMVVVTAPVATRSGYGSHGRDICRSLISMDKFDVKIIPVRWGTTPQNALNEQDPNDKMIIDRLKTDGQFTRQPDVHIHVVIPNEFQNFAKYNIGVTAGIETTACPPEWIEGMNRMDLNIVPSKFTKQILEEINFEKKERETEKSIGTLKSEKPVEVLFEGADTKIYKKTKDFSERLVKEFKKIDESFCFLFVGHWLQGGLTHDRKDVGMLIKTFLETFKNKKKKPAIVLKSSGAGFSVIDRREIEEKIKAIKKDVDGEDLPNVYLLHGDLTDDEMNELYNHPKVKAHVSFTHGEGFGRPLLEASLSEKPILVSGWSGHVDFLQPSLAIHLPGGMTKVHKSSFPKGIFVGDSYWFSVNYQAASKVIEEVYNNYKKHTLNAKKLSMVNKSTFSLKAMTEKFEKILNQYLPEFSVEVPLNLPKLKKKDTHMPIQESTLPQLKKKSTDSKPKGISLPKLKKVN